SFTTFQDLWTYIFPAVALTVVMIFMRHATVPGTNFSLGSRTLPSTLGVGIAFGGLVNLAQQLTVEREDGTLLRAKAVPNGILSSLVGKIVPVSGMLVIGLVLQLIPGLVLFPGLQVSGVTHWLTFIWVLVVGLVACLPLGAIIGSLFNNPRNMGLVMLPL